MFLCSPTLESKQHQANFQLPNPGDHARSRFIDLCTGMAIHMRHTGKPCACGFPSQMDPFLLYVGATWATASYNPSTLRRVACTSALFNRTRAHPPRLVSCVFCILRHPHTLTPFHASLVACAAPLDNHTRVHPFHVS